MDSSRSFTELNEEMKPRFTTNKQLYSTLTRTEGRQSSSLRNKSSGRTTILPKEPEANCAATTTKMENKTQEEDLVSGGPQVENCANLLLSEDTCPVSVPEAVDEVDLVEDHSCFSFQPEEKDDPHDQTKEGTGQTGSDLGATTGKDAELQSSFIDGTLPDVINSGRLLSRRRTVGHFALKEVRKEVELSRKRSIKLRAQVEKLQKIRDGPGWSQDRERVTEEVLSVLKLLHPLTDPESSPLDPTSGKNCLDMALTQLQSVARKLAINYTQQEHKSGIGHMKGVEESALLQQALRDRDDAIEKKKAMEAELLRSKAEQMCLNNQLLEAIQKRLELSLELEAWKDDVQKMVRQQMHTKQAEEVHKKTSRVGILRRINRQPLQRPPTFPVPQYNPPSTNTSQVFVTKSSTSAPPTPTTPTIPQRNNWKDKFRRNKTSNQEDQDAERLDDGFQVISLD